jgi:hypothetical protein
MEKVGVEVGGGAPPPTSTPSPLPRQILKNLNFMGIKYTSKQQKGAKEC